MEASRKVEMVFVAQAMAEDLAHWGAVAVCGAGNPAHDICVLLLDHGRHGELNES